MFSIPNLYLKNLYWQASGNSLAQLVNILSMPVITRLFTPGEMGLFGLALQYVSLLTILISFRFEHLIIWPKEDRDAQHFAKFVLKFGALACLTWTFLLATTAPILPIESEFHIWLLLMPIVAYTIITSQALQQIDQRSSNFKLSGISELLNRCTNNSLAILSGIISFGGLSLIIAVGIGQFSKSLIFRSHFGLFRGSFIKDIRDALTAARALRLYRLNLSLIFSHLMLSVTTVIPLSYIAFEWGEARVGQISLVFSTLALPTALFGNAVGQVFYQQSAKQFAQNRPFDELLFSNLKMLLLIGIPCFTIVHFFGPFLYTLVFGAPWAEAGRIASYYSIAAALSFFTTPFDRSGIIVNAWWYGSAWHFARLITTISVVGVSWIFEITFWDFIYLLIVQISVMYLIDGLASIIFAKRRKAYN